MKLTVIKEDATVYVDRVSHNGISMAGAPSNVHALQWNETAGWVEFAENSDGTKPPNESISMLPQWALDLIPLWQAAEDAAQAQAAALVGQPISSGAQTL